MDITDAYHEFCKRIESTDVRELSFRQAFDAEEREETERIRSSHTALRPSSLLHDTREVRS